MAGVTFPTEKSPTADPLPGQGVDQRVKELTSGSDLGLQITAHCKSWTAITQHLEYCIWCCSAMIMSSIPDVRLYLNGAPTALPVPPVHSFAYTLLHRGQSFTSVRPRAVVTQIPRAAAGSLQTAEANLLGKSVSVCCILSQVAGHQTALTLYVLYRKRC